MGKRNNKTEIKKESTEERENANKYRLPLMFGSILLSAGMVLLVLWGLHEFCSSGCSSDYTSIRCSDGWFCQATQKTPWWAALFTALPAVLIWYWRDKNKLQDIRISQESQVTGRFVAAVDLLSQNRGDVARIGGIYALRRISKDSPPDKETIVSTLSAFVLKSLPPRPPREADYVDDFSKNLDMNYPRLLIDIQIALRVLAQIGGADFEKENLEGKNLYSANLSGANLSSTNLAGALLYGANLQGANLENATISDADLRNSQLAGANLWRAGILNTRFTGATYSVSTTTLPGGLDPEAHRMVKVEEESNEKRS